MVNLELYKVFYTVAKCKSITKAAEELYISQPAVSHAIKQLETELGGKLFNRVSRGMELTDPGGKQMFEAVEKAMTTLDDAEKNFSSIKAVATGQVKIAASDNVINYFLINKIKRFRNLYPKVGLKFINAPRRGQRYAPPPAAPLPRGGHRYPLSSAGRSPRPAADAGADETAGHVCQSLGSSWTCSL